jgi:hypothetical protein
LTATNSGTFTVVATAFVLNESGSYTLHLAHIPGAFVVSPGQQGGVLTNGLLNLATNEVGSLDMWSFSANAGDSVMLRMGTTGFHPRIDLYAPDGHLLGTAGNAAFGTIDALLSLTVTNSGTFIIVASAYDLNERGTYTLSLAHSPGAVFVSPGDEGGAMQNGVTYIGTNSMGDLDVWSFYGTIGDSNLFRIGTTNYVPWLRLYGPSGALVGEAFTANGGNRTNFLSFVVTNSGNYTLVSSSYYLSQSGTYNLKQSRVPPDLPLQDQTINEGTQFNLPISAADPDEPGKSLTFLLVSAPPGVALTTLGPTNAVISWATTEVDGPSTNTIVASVTDVVNGQAFTRTNSFTLVVNELNTPPVLPSIGQQTVNEQNMLIVTNTAVDTDIPANALTYTLIDPPLGVVIDTNGVIRWTPTEAQGPGTYTITTVVTDYNPWAINEQHMSDTNSFSVVVNEVNSPPVLPVLANRTINELATLTVTNTATDSDLPVNPLTYTLVNPPLGAVIDPNGIITWTPTEAQGPSTNIITTVVTDSNPSAINAQHLSTTNSFVVVVNEVNSPPTLPNIANQTVNEGSQLIVTNTATDTDIPANPLTYSLVNPPQGVNINANGIITWTPTEAQGPSTNIITTVVTDTNTNAVNSQHLSATNSFTVVVNEINTAPVLPVIGLQTVNEQTTLIVTNTATDSDIPINPLTYQLINPPLGAKIDSNGIITWTPTEAQGPGTNVITTVVTDSNPWAINAQHLSATNQFTVIVNEVNTPPVLQPIGDSTIHYGVLFSVQAVASDSDLPTNTLTFTLVQAPTNMTINSASGQITWTPLLSQIGTNTIIVRVTDNGQPPLSDSTTFHLFVLGSQPSLSITGLPGHLAELNIFGDIGISYEIQISTNLVDWEDLVPVTITTSPYPYIDPSSSTVPLRFFRLKMN